MNYRSQPKSRLAVRSLCTRTALSKQSRPHAYHYEAMTRHRNFDLFFVIRVYHKKIGHVLNLPVTKLRSDICVRLRDIAEKQVHEKLKPIVVTWRVPSDQEGAKQSIRHRVPRRM